MEPRKPLNIIAAALVILLALSTGSFPEEPAQKESPDIGKLPSKVIITGKIVQVATKNRTIVLRLIDGRDRSYTVTKDAWILRNKQKASLGDFRSGEYAALGICSPLNAKVMMVNLVMDEPTHREYAAKKVPPSVYSTQSGKTSSTSSPPFLSRTGGGMTAAPSPSQLPAMPPEGPSAPTTPQPPATTPGAVPYGPGSVIEGSSDEDRDEAGTGDFSVPSPGAGSGMQVVHIQGQVTQIVSSQRVVHVLNMSTGATVQIHIDARLAVQDVKTRQVGKFENIRVGSILDVQGLQSGPVVEARIVYIR
jgi:hypothetical protein